MVYEQMFPSHEDIFSPPLGGVHTGMEGSAKTCHLGTLTV